MSPLPHHTGSTGRTGPAAAAVAAQPVAHRREAMWRPAVAVTRGDTDQLSQETDQRLVERSRAGDVAAYRVLAGRHRARLYSSAIRTLADSDDPEDVMRDMVAHLRDSLAVFAEASPL